MNKLSEITVHVYHSEPSFDDVYPAFIVWNRISNFAQANFIHAENEDEAIAHVYEFETSNSDFDPSQDYVELSAEEVELDQEGIEWYHRQNHD